MAVEEKGQFGHSRLSVLQSGAGLLQLYRAASKVSRISEPVPGFRSQYSCGIC